MSYAVRLFDDREVVTAWILENLEDMREDSTFFFTESDGLTYVHFVSQNDAYAFEEDYADE